MTEDRLVPLETFGLRKMLEQKSPAWSHDGKVYAFWLVVWISKYWFGGLKRLCRRLLGHELQHVHDGIFGTPQHAPGGHHPDQHRCLRADDSSNRETWDHGSVTDGNVGELVKHEPVRFVAPSLSQ